ncbi:MAG: hypothetical protein NTZ97_04175 [Candidatus Moranbacteria bacterium]|nr:hypothetical protein [Candidatus Moranbacteria bacterium]
MDLTAIWNLIPNELKLVIMMSLPGIGKGSVFISRGICAYDFSPEKAFLLCTMGSLIKVTYYFGFIFRAECMISKGILSQQRFNSLVTNKAKNRYRVFYRYIGLVTLTALAFFGIGILPAACLAYVCQTGFFRGIMATTFGAITANYLIAFGAIRLKIEIIVFCLILKEGLKTIIEFIQNLF